MKNLFDYRPEGYYVYVHRKSTNNEIFYIGKGKNYRFSSKSGRNKFWRNVYSKYGCLVEIVLDKLSEEQALELERELVKFYGKRIDDDGVLTNLFDGGGDCSASLVGDLNPNADKNVYKFYNLKTEEVFEGTRCKFTEKTGITTAQLFYCNSLNRIKDWTLLDKVKELGKDFVSNSKAGQYNWTADKNVYEFVNIKTNERFKGNRYEFTKMSGLSCKGLFKSNPNIKVGWWCLVDNYEIAIESNKNKLLVYKFRHEDGRTFEGDRKSFVDFVGNGAWDLFRTNKRGNSYKQYKGWKIVE